MLAPKERNDRLPLNFDLMTFMARRAFLPASSWKRGGFKGLALWICRSTKKSGFTYLIEDFRRDDQDPQAWSGNTALSMLFEVVSKEMKKTGVTLEGIAKAGDEWSFSVDGDFHSRLQGEDVLTDIFKAGGVPIKGSVFIRTCSKLESSGCYTGGASNMRFRVDISVDDAEPDKSRVHVRRDTFVEVCARFATTPHELLTEWGAEVGPERQIDTLYRIRHTMIEASTSGRGQGAVIGYPIVIAESPSPLIPA